jgi:hypothetical protein
MTGAAALGVVCRTCAFTNPGGMAFCGRCGTPLPASLPPGPGS